MKNTLVGMTKLTNIGRICNARLWKKVPFKVHKDEQAALKIASQSNGRRCLILVFVASFLKDV